MPLKPMAGAGDLTPRPLAFLFGICLIGGIFAIAVAKSPTPAESTRTVGMWMEYEGFTGLEDLVLQSSAVVLGRVVDRIDTIYIGESGKLPLTRFRVETLQAAVGSVPSEFAITQPGGLAQDDEGVVRNFVAVGDPTIAEGQLAVFFLQPVDAEDPTWPGLAFYKILGGAPGANDR